jgi:hypothetical protein
MVVGVLFHFKWEFNDFDWFIGLVVVSFTLFVLVSYDKFAKKNCVVESKCNYSALYFLTTISISFIIDT